MMTEIKESVEVELYVANQAMSDHELTGATVIGADNCEIHLRKEDDLYILVDETEYSCGYMKLSKIVGFFA